MSAATLEPKTATASVAPQTAGVQVKVPVSPADQFERYDTIDTPRIVVIGFVAAILTFVAILSAQAVFFAADKAEVQKKEVAIADTLTSDALTQQQNRLAAYGWVDSAKGVVSIPVTEAMKLVVTEQQSKSEGNAAQ